VNNLYGIVAGGLYGPVLALVVAATATHAVFTTRIYPCNNKGSGEVVLGKQSRS